MLTVKDKHVVVGADFAGYPLKEAVKAHLEERGWTVTDLTPDADTAPMYHRVGFALGAQIAEGKFERALAFCGTGMGIHIAASKCPHVHAAVCESVPAARRRQQREPARHGCLLRRPAHRDGHGGRVPRVLPWVRVRGLGRLLRVPPHRVRRVRELRLRGL